MIDVLVRLGIESYFNHFQWKRFKDIEDLKEYMNKTLDNGFKLTKINDIDKESIENDFQDYEIVGTIENDDILCDFSLYYCYTRINEILITEIGIEIE